MVDASKRTTKEREIIAKKSRAYIIISSVVLCLLGLVIIFIYFQENLRTFFPFFVAALIGYAVYLLFLLLKPSVLISKDKDFLYVVTGLKNQKKIPLDSIYDIKYKVGRVFENTPSNSFGKVIIYTNSQKNAYTEVTTVGDLDKVHIRLKAFIKSKS